MSDFHGLKKRRSYFEGWYFKQSGQTGTVALIPAYHIDRFGNASASLQVVTDEGSYCARFPGRAFRADPDRFFVRLGGSAFSLGGCTLNVAQAGCEISGTLHFGPLSPPEGDIMGPFRHVPLMQCRHSVLSLSHRVDGRLSINGQTYKFVGARGYLEGDRGTSFPERYLWTQCTWEDNCVMLSVADIPLGFAHFTGCLGCVYIDKKERRVATYLGARPTHISGKGVCLRQGPLTLTTELLEAHPHPLLAPLSGDMVRTIHESISSSVRYICTLGKDTLFDFTSDKASFESHWDDAHGPLAY